MLLAVLPHSFVAAAVRVRVHAIAIFFIINVLSFVFSAVGPLIVTLTMHIILFPVAFIHSSIFPSVYAIASDLVLLPVALELTVVGPGVDAVPVLHAVLVLADVLRAVDPRLLSLALLHVVDPFAFVAAAVHVGVDAETARLIGLELAYVDVALGMPEGAFAFGFVLEPVALVDGAIDPLLYAVAATLLRSGLFVDQHLALVHAAVREHVVVHEDEAIDIIP